MYRRVWLAVIALWLSVVSGGGLAADVIHAADPFDGQWKLDLERSPIT